MRLIKTIANGHYQAKIYRDAEWDEYVVVFFRDGKRLPDADYHTGDWDDADATAQAVLNSYNESAHA